MLLAYSDTRTRRVMMIRLLLIRDLVQQMQVSLKYNYFSFFFAHKLKYLFLLIFIRMWTRCGRCEMLGQVAMLLGHVVFW